MSIPVQMNKRIKYSKVTKVSNEQFTMANRALLKLFLRCGATKHNKWKKRESNWVRDFQQIDEIHLYSASIFFRSYIGGLVHDLSSEGQI